MVSAKDCAEEGLPGLMQPTGDPPAIQSMLDYAQHDIRAAENLGKQSMRVQQSASCGSTMTRCVADQ